MYKKQLLFLQTSNFRPKLSKTMAYGFPQIILGLQIKSLSKEKMKNQDPVLERFYSAVVEGNEEGTSNNHSKFLSK